MPACVPWGRGVGCLHRSPDPTLPHPANSRNPKQPGWNFFGGGYPAGSATRYPLPHCTPAGIAPTLPPTPPVSRVAAMVLRSASASSHTVIKKRRLRTKSAPSAPLAWKLDGLDRGAPLSSFRFCRPRGREIAPRGARHTRFNLFQSAVPLLTAYTF